MVLGLVALGPEYYPIVLGWGGMQTEFILKYDLDK